MKSYLYCRSQQAPSNVPPWLSRELRAKRHQGSSRVPPTLQRDGVGKKRGWKLRFRDAWRLRRTEHGAFNESSLTRRGPACAFGLGRQCSDRQRQKEEAFTLAWFIFTETFWQNAAETPALKRRSDFLMRLSSNPATHTHTQSQSSNEEL